MAEKVGQPQVAGGALHERAWSGFVVAIGGIVLQNYFGRQQTKH